MVAGTYSTMFPSFIEHSTDSFNFSIITDDITKIGLYRIMAELTVFDSTGACLNQVLVATEFSVIVFIMKSQPLENKKQIITYTTLVYDFPKFV